MGTKFASQCIVWLSIVACQLVADEDVRLYSGSIQVPTLGNLDMTLGISDSEEGTFILLTVLTQGAKNLPLDATYIQDGSITAALPQAQLTFVVKENVDQTRLTGRMIQGIEFDIDFERVFSIPTLNRPQQPVEPFPYRSREVTALHPEGHLLAGTLTIPEGVGPFPCAVLISGSGMQDRDESFMGHKPFLVISDYLTRSEIAVLRFDDRGVGGSVIENIEEITLATSVDFATDVEVMLHAARLHPEIDRRRVGVIGHSEGGLIGPMVAVEDDSLAFVVMLAGPGVPGYELLPVQQALLMQSSGADPARIDEILNASMSLYELIEANASEQELREQMSELVHIQLSVQGLELSEELVDGAIDEGLDVLSSPWMQFFLMYDPAPVLAQVHCPVLAMNGTKDVQVSSRQNLPPIQQAMQETGGDITIVELEGLNHLFQPANTGSVDEYTAIEITIDPIALEVMRDWIVEVTDND